MQTELSQRLFARFARLAHAHTGIRIGAGKEQLVAARVTKRMRRLRLKSFSEYAAYLEAHPEELQEFVNVMTTNLTRFFREEAHFGLLAKSLARKRGRRVRIWCAAASTGQEVWSLAMVAGEALGAGDWRILATDIDTKVLATAKAARYPAGSLHEIPSHLADKYVERAGKELEISAFLQERVAFARLNLAAPPFPMSGPLDVVFCRNVMIYFGPEVRQGIVSQVERVLAPDGEFYLGHSESLAGLKTSFERDAPALYVPRAGRVAA